MSRVSDFLIKPGPASGFFFFKNPYPTLFLIRPGKIRPIRVGSGRVPVDRAKIAIPTFDFIIGVSLASTMSVTRRREIPLLFFCRSQTHLRWIPSEQTYQLTKLVSSIVIYIYIYTYLFLPIYLGSVWIPLIDEN